MRAVKSISLRAWSKAATLRYVKSDDGQPGQRMLQLEEEAEYEPSTTSLTTLRIPVSPGIAIWKKPVEGYVVSKREE